MSRYCAHGNVFGRCPSCPTGWIDCGKNASPERVSEIAALIRADIEPFLAATFGVSEQLQKLSSIYKTSAMFLSGGRPTFTPFVEYGARTWADRHLEGLGWAFLGLVALIPFILLFVR